jgi:hypothetical protein
VKRATNEETEAYSSHVVEYFERIALIKQPAAPSPYALSLSGSRATVGRDGEIWGGWQAV